MNSYKGSMFCFALLFVCLIILCAKSFSGAKSISPKRAESENLSSKTENMIENIDVDVNNYINTEHAITSIIEEDDSTTVAVSGSDSFNGRIIRKTMLPYTANTKYSNICVNNNCGTDIDVCRLVSSGLSFNIKKSSEPEILIMHTHTTEAYMTEESTVYNNSDIDRTANTNESVVAVGNKMAEVLKKNGFSVLHDTTIHDYPAYTGSYSRSKETVERYQKQYPSLKIIIDLHRDSITYDNKNKQAPVIEVNGKKAAQIMLVMGSQTGNVTEYPNWQENLKLALKIQQVTETVYPALARPLLLRSSKYNQDLSPGSILIEVGSEVNTIEEALYSAELLGNCLSVTLNSLK